MKALDDLEDAAHALARHDEARAPLLEARDKALVKARQAGATWAQMQEASGLSARGLSQALERGGA